MRLEVADTTTPSKKAATALDPAAGGGDKPSEERNGNPHTNIDDLPLDLLEILNLAPENRIPGRPPKIPASPGPSEPLGGKLSLASSPKKTDSPAKSYSHFLARPQILGTQTKLGSSYKHPSPPTARAETAQSGGGGDELPPSPAEALSPFSLFSLGSLQSVSSAEIPAEYLTRQSAEKDEAAAEKLGSPLEVARGGKAAAEKLEEEVAAPEFSFPKLDPATHPTLSWA
jgi:hypothetical protein